MFSKTKIKILLSIIALTAFVLSSPETSAQALNFTQNVQIGDTNLSGPIGSGSLGLYLQTIYKYAIGAVGILATVVMMFGGVMWITAAGSNERVSSAKAWIGASLTGLVLTLSSYTILYLVNPNTLTFRPIELEKPEEIIAGYDKNGCCVLLDNVVLTTTMKACEENDDYINFYVDQIASNGDCVKEPTGCCISSCEGEKGTTDYECICIESTKINCVNEFIDEICENVLHLNPPIDCK